LKVLLLNQFFHPDPAPTGQLLADVATHLSAEGHEVVVVCTRRPAYAKRSPHHAHRLASWLSFYLGAAWRSLRARPDLVLTLTTPPLLPLIGTLLKKLRHARHTIWEMDLYPDVAVALGVLSPRSLLTRATGALADYSRRQADAIIALGPCMKDRLIARGIPASKIQIAENWADGARIRPQPFPSGPLTVLYSGNLGMAHDVDTIATAMRRLASDDTIRFVFAGAGSRRKPLEDLRLPNVTFLGYQDATRLSDHLAACHLGLVTQNPATLGCVVPSKTYALMAAARPILFIGPREATPARLIESYQCGWQIDPGDVESLLSLLRVLDSDPALLHQPAHRSHQAFLTHYTRPQGVASICSILGVSSPSPPCLRGEQSEDQPPYPHSEHRNIEVDQQPNLPVPQS
jgi:glycosyltransferase involved in cell wall biosynthesis